MTVVDARQTETEARLVARTRELIPELRSRAEETAALRHVPVENIRAMQAAGSLRAVQSTRNGGYGFGMRTHLDVVSALAEGCAATAWVAGVVQAHSWLLSHFPPQAQDDVYGADRDAVVSAVIGPRGTATRTADGYTLSGFWPFASGNESSTWLLLGAVVRDESGAVIDQGDFLVPTDAVDRKDDWYVNGLTGTGSCSVSVDALQIPAHRFVSLPAVIMGTAPGRDLHDGWGHRCAPVPVLCLALTGSAIGIARQALSDFPALVKGKTIAYTADDQYSHPLTHMQAADAAMHIHEGELILYHCADQIDAAAREGRELDLHTRARMRLDCAQGVRRCLEGVEILFHASGASGIRLASPLTRAVADLRAINQHGLLNLEMNQEVYGRVVLGLEPNTPLL
jgi:3-hydroxy-9,10-secoandrosta-1,3,5(10)-triene-9,17-dione monooxygenase